jgi:phosphoserine aminotransferase
MLSAKGPLPGLNPGFGPAVENLASGRVFNFNAGPSVLPEEVLRQFQGDIWNFRGTGMGIMEHSHRAAPYQRVLDEAIADVRKVGSIPASYHVLFMTGGSSSQNYIVPANLLWAGQTADYIVTGYWGQRSFDDAVQYAASYGGQVHLAATSKDTNHSYIPSATQTAYSSASPAYVHITSNNTIYGTQWRTPSGHERLPEVPAGTPIVSDACSDIFSRPIDVTRYGLIYASAQKNLGVTGATVVIVSDELVQRASTKIPRMLQLRTFVKEQSMPNTPPAFTIYTVGVMARWILEQGGVHTLHERNVRKAQHLYDALDAAKGFYTPHARTQDRSLMNVVFRCNAGEAMDVKFTAEAAGEGLAGLAGHRAAGGMRASLYNAMPEAGAKALASFIADFARRNG